MVEYLPFSFLKRKLKIIKYLKLDHVVGFSATPAYVHWLADVHFGSFAPAFTPSFHDSECSRKPPNAHSLSR